MDLLRYISRSSGVLAELNWRLYRPPSSPRRSGVRPDVSMRASSSAMDSICLPVLERANARCSRTSACLDRSSGSLRMKSSTAIQSFALSIESRRSRNSAMATGKVIGGIPWIATSSCARFIRSLGGAARTARTRAWNAASFANWSFMLDAACSSTLNGNPLIEDRRNASRKPLDCILGRELERQHGRLDDVAFGERVAHRSHLRHIEELPGPISREQHAPLFLCCMTDTNFVVNIAIRNRHVGKYQIGKV